MEAVLARALGPQVYGNFNFSTSMFTQLTGFLDMGTSTCFYNALSRRQYEMPLVAFYGRVSALVFLVTMLAGVFLLVPGLGDMLLPDVPLWYAPLAAFYGFLLWGTRVVRSMNDALGLTVPGELLRSGVNLLGAIIILALFWFGFLNAGSLFGLQYLMMGSIVIGCLAIMRRSWAHIDLSLTRDQRLSYTREFSTTVCRCSCRRCSRRWPFPPNAGCSSGSTAAHSRAISRCPNASAPRVFCSYPP